MDVDALKTEVIEAFGKLCYKLGNGYTDEDYSDILDKIMYIELQDCLNG